ncbi:YadA-like family protein [Campylobacter geochelonis]|uniref:Outer membrane protein n=1 Tax=Campylobacter geochelonis TaxID=1780362 RepID=A0A128EHQ0_9BACT|nr:YadA-like family protein [Campylobacter geochelonis]QKF71915.1 putative autotransporter adhesin (YadA domain) [Campylobacter geochelonis]CZE47882.1 outer membrane protein [Campylobacter geochelonis]
MNKAYKHIYKEGVGWVAVSESSSGRSKMSKGSVAVGLGFVQTLKTSFSSTLSSLKSLSFVAALALGISTLPATTYADGFYSDGTTTGMNTTTNKQIALNRNNVGIVTGAGNDTTGAKNTAIGANSGQSVSGNYNNAIGENAGQNVGGSNNTAIGRNAGKNVTSSYNIAIGENAGTGVQTTDTISIGRNSVINGTNSIALGSGARTGKIADTANINKQNKIITDTNAAIAALDKNAADYATKKAELEAVKKTANDELKNIYKASANTVAIGTSARSEVEGGVALGFNSVSSVGKGQVGYDPSKKLTDAQKASGIWTSRQGAVDVGSRQITQLSAGTKDNDAVNVAQLKAAQTKFVSVNSASGGNVNNDGAKGLNSVAIGVSANALGDNSLANGYAAKIGSQADEKEYTTQNKIIADAQKAIESLDKTTADYKDKKAEQDAIIKAANTKLKEIYATNKNALALGVNARTQAVDTLALGTNTRALVEGGIALGSGSLANREKGEIGYDGSGKASTWLRSTEVFTSRNAAFAIGTDSSTRQIIGVAAGSKDTDAVNVGQLKAAQTRFVGVNGTTNNSNYENDGARGTYSIAIGANAKTYDKATDTLYTAEVNKIKAAQTAISKLDRKATDYKTKLKEQNDIIDAARKEITTLDANSERAIALGALATTGAKYAVAIGNNSLADSESATALGNGAKALKENATALGKEAKALEENSVAIGNASNAIGLDSIAIGNSSVANEKAVAISGSASKGGVAIGRGAYARLMPESEDKMLSFGKEQIAGVAIGYGTITRAGAVDIGQRDYRGLIGDADYTGKRIEDIQNSIGTTTVGANSFNSGMFASINGSYSSISKLDQKPTSSLINRLYNLSIAGQGLGATISGSLNSIENRNENKKYSGIGNSIVGFVNKTHLSNASVIIGTANEITNSYLDVDNNPPIDDLTSASSAKDLQDKLMKYAQSEKLGSVLVMGGSNKSDSALFSQVQGVGNILNGKGSTKNLKFNKDGIYPGYSTFNYINGFENTANDVNRLVSIGTNNKITNADNNFVLGNNYNLAGTETARAENNVIIGFNSKKDNGNLSESLKNSIGIGTDVKLGAENTIAIGTGAQATAKNAISIGTGNIVSGANSGAFGDPSIINAANSYSVGNNNAIGKTSENVFVLGNNVVLGGTKDALGKFTDGDSVSGAVALGNKTNVTVADGVALGSGSVASVDKGVVGYDVATKKASTYESATWKSTHSAVSIGKADGTITRQITGVAAGFNDTDAVNVAQLKALNTSISTAVESSKIHYVSIKEGATEKDKNYDNNGATGEGAIAIGSAAMVNGDYSVAVGSNAGYKSEEGKYNNYFGGYAGSQAKGNNNTYIGDHAGFKSDSSVVDVTNKQTRTGYSVAIGDSAGQEAIGNSNTFVGSIAGYKVNGFRNTSLGYNAGASTTGNNNLALGNEAGILTTGGSNIAQGFQAGKNTKGNMNFASGYQAGVYTEGDGNIALGVYAGIDIKLNPDGKAVITNGNETILDETKKVKGNYNTAIGFASGSAVTANYNTAIGFASGIASGLSLSEKGEVKDGKNIALGFGTGNLVKSANNLAIGVNAGVNVNTKGTVTSGNHIAIGVGAGSNLLSGNDSVSIGTNAGIGMILGQRNVAIGYGAGSNLSSRKQGVQGTDNTAVGGSAGQGVVGGNNSAFGASAGLDVIGDRNSAFGTSAGFGVTGSNSTAIGRYAGSNVVGSSNIAIGEFAGRGFTTNRLSANEAISIGKNATAKGNLTIAFGKGAIAGAYDENIVNGYNNEIVAAKIAINGLDKTAADYSAKLREQNDKIKKATDELNKLLAENSNAIAIGTGAQATAENSISIGTGNKVSGKNSGAFGDPNEVSGTGSYAIGNNNTIKANDAFVLGSGVTNEVEGSVVLGNGSTVEKAVATKSVTINGKTYNFAGANPVSTVSVGSSGKERTITNVAAGRISASSTDAINGSQLYATNLAIASISATANTNITNLENKVNAGFNIQTDSSTTENIAMGDTVTINGDSKNIKVTNDGKKIKVSLAKNITEIASLTTTAGIVLDNGGIKLNNDGKGNKKITGLADGEKPNDAVNYSQLQEVKNQIGTSSTAVATNPVSVKTAPTAKGDDSLAVGMGAKTTNNNSVALGTNATSSGKNSVALGAGSNDGGRANTVSVGSAGKERTISNVAAGVYGTDAVNLNQLNAGLQNVYNQIGEYQDEARAGTASAIALGSLGQATIPGKGMFGVGGGSYQGQSAVSVGVSKMSDDGKWVFKAGASYDSQRNIGTGASINFHF